MAQTNDTEPTRKNQLVSNIAAELSGAMKLAHYRALNQLEAEIERLYPAERYDNLLNPEFDWTDNE